MMGDSLTLKWGTIKGWDVESDAALAILQKWSDLGVTYSAMAQRNTPEQKTLICELIDICDEPIHNDWSGEAMSREQAKKYIMEYRQ